MEQWNFEWHVNNALTRLVNVMHAQVVGIGHKGYPPRRARPETGFDVWFASSSQLEYHDVAFVQSRNRFNYYDPSNSPINANDIYA
jgi:hypothetical protein